MTWPLPSKLLITCVDSVVSIVLGRPPDIHRGWSNIACLISDIIIFLFFYFWVSPAVVLPVCFSLSSSTSSFIDFLLLLIVVNLTDAYSWLLF